MKNSIRLATIVFAAVVFIAGGGLASAAGNPSPIAPAAVFHHPDGTVGDAFGVTVAISSDGTEAWISAPGVAADGIADLGEVYLYTSDNGVWAQQPTLALLNPGLDSLADFGGALAISTDDSTLAVAAPLAMKVYVYSKANGVWPTTPTAVLNDPDTSDGGTYGDGFGQALAISGNGNILLVGAPFVNPGQIIGVGAAYIFQQQNGLWSSTPTATINSPRDVALEEFGTSVAVSENASVAIVGPSASAGSGGAFGYMYTESNGAWNATPASTLKAPWTGIAGVGSGAALSAAGTTALFGAWSVGNPSGPANNFQGIFYLYNSSGTTWPAAPAVSFQTTSPQSQQFGSTVALSADGTVAVNGNPNQTLDGLTGLGAVYIYTQSNGAWMVTPATTLLDPAASGYSQSNYFEDAFGNSVALSSDGAVILIGAPQPGGLTPPPPMQIPTHQGAGEAYVFESSNNWDNPPPAPPAPPPVSNPSSSGGGGGAFGLIAMWLLLTLFLIRTRIGSRKIRAS
ncbi:MAG: hypothetical protein ACRETQ_01925 [Gammaproteobacteria bacterium]